MDRMINLQDFISCTFKSQVEIVSDLGRSVCQHTDPDHVITLFYLETFFVEVFFNRSKIRITHMHVYPPAALPKYYYDTGALFLEKLSQEEAAHIKSPVRNNPPVINYRASHFNGNNTEKRETGNGKRETGNGKRETGNGKRETIEKSGLQNYTGNGIKTDQTGKGAINIPTHHPLFSTDFSA